MVGPDFLSEPTDVAGASVSRIPSCEDPRTLTGHPETRRDSGRDLSGISHIVEDMNLVSVRIITDDVDRLVDFYAQLTHAEVDRPVADFAEIRTPNGTIALGSTRTVALFGPGAAEAAANRSVIVELLVDDVDAAYATLQEWVTTFVNEPTTMPWGNRSLLLRDPDGNLVNLFSPATVAAREKFSRYER